MDLRDFEPARTDRRLSGETAQAPALHHRVYFAFVIVQLGVMLLALAVVAPLLSLLLPRRIAGRLGRSAVSMIYRCCWTIAKGLAPTSPLRAFALYLNAVLRGCYPPKLAAVVFIQVFVPDTLYRRMADRVIALTERKATPA